MIRSATLNTKIILTVSVTVVLTMATLGGLLSYHKLAILRRSVALEQSIGVTVLANELVLGPGGSTLELTADGSGRMTGATWARVPEFTTHELVDLVAQETFMTLSVLTLAPQRGEFRRVSTSAVSDAGTRLLGTGIDAATTETLHNGRPASGELRFGTTPYLARWVPIMNAAGKTIGAFEAAVPKSRVAGPLRLALLISFGTTALLVIIAIGATTVILCRVMRPLGEVGAAMRRIASGDYSARVPHADKPDAVGEIARSLQSFGRDLAAAKSALGMRTRADRDARRNTEAEAAAQARVVAEIGEGLERLADGDLTGRIDSPPDAPFPAGYDGLRQNYNMAIEQLSQILHGMSEMVSSVHNGAGEINHASDDLATRAETQAATLEQSAAAINQMTENIRSTSERATEAENAGRASREQAESGADVVRDAIEAMRLIEQSSEKVRRIIGVIDDIAFQTNLLALNAGVEAARAGEAGKGLAVVASEFRSLAQRASESAKEIDNLITESTGHVNTGSRLVADTGARLESILENTTELQRIVSDIAGAAREQAIGIEEINTGVAQLDAVTQQNAAAAGQVNTDSTRLRRKAGELADNLERFRVDAAAAATGGNVTPLPALPPPQDVTQPPSEDGENPLGPHAAKANGTTGMPTVTLSDFDGF